MSNFETKKIVINKSQSNKRLDQALTQLTYKYSRSQIKILLQNKNVKISNAKMPKCQNVKMPECQNAEM